MSPDPAGFVVRGATPVGDTGSVPQGTMLTVPSARPSGTPGSAPIVAVNTVHWYSDPAFLSAAGGALVALAPIVVDVLTQDPSVPFKWRSFMASAILTLVAYFRKNTNSVLK